MQGIHLANALGFGLVLPGQDVARGGQLAAEQGQGEVVAVEFAQQVDLAARLVQFDAVNLAIVALLGVIMRYKILYPLPFVDQKKFLHAHSHFAFSGWVTLALIQSAVKPR